MGYIRHSTLIVTTYSGGVAAEAHAKACEIMGKALVTDIYTTPANPDFVFYIIPDGSKEGWPTSNEGDEHTEQYIAWLNDQRFSDGSTSLKWAALWLGVDSPDDTSIRAQWSFGEPKDKEDS